jgi:GWxTD domain-containing protein
MFLLLLGAALAPSSGASADPDGDPAGSVGRLRFVVDAVSFPRSPGNTTEEVYLLLASKDLRFEDRGNGTAGAEIRVRFHFRSWPTGETILRKTMNAVLPMEPSAEDGGLQVLQHAFLLREGPYQLTVEVEDLRTRGFGFFRLFGRHPKKGKAVAYYEAKGFRPEGLAISDIQLARSLAPDAASEFAKGNLEVIPQPNRLFGALMPVLSFYYEIYDLGDEQDPAGEPYRVTHQLVVSDGAVVLEENVALHAAPGISRFRRSGTFDLAELEPGSYDLRVSVESPSRGLAAGAERRFRVIWKSEDTAGWDAETSDGRAWTYQGRTSEESLIDEMRPILGQRDLQRLEGMGSEERMAWIEAYWEARDPSPGTPQNELREEHYQRIRTANARYGALLLKGIETDRGRIYIRYGEPDEIRIGFADQSFVPESSMRSGPMGQIGEVGRSRGGYNVEEKEYEVWTYNERGRILGDRGKVAGGLGLRFVFADLEGYGNYRLVESSEVGEY